MKVKTKLQIFALIVILLVGFLLRLRQWNDLMIYPDSYHYLISSDNVFVCGKPFYCAVVNVISSIVVSHVFVLRIFSLICSTVSIIATYFLFENGFKRSGVVASILFALSFSIISWTNFIIPDMFAVLLFLIFLIYRKNPLSIVILFLTALVRPEYLILLLVAIPTLLGSKRAKVLSLSFFLVGTLYYYLSTDHSSLVIALKDSAPLIITKLFLFDVLIIYSAVIGIASRFRRFSRPDWFFLIQILLFVAIFLWQNPMNWRYAVHLIVPLIYFASWSFKYLRDGIARGMGIYFFFAILSLVAIFSQLYISYTGVKSQIPESNYEEVLVMRADDILSMLAINDRRYATYFDKVVQYKTGREAINPLESNLEIGDVLIYDAVLERAGFSIDWSIQTREIARYNPGGYFYFGSEKVSSQEVRLYMIDSITLE